MILVSNILIAFVLTMCASDASMKKFKAKSQPTQIVVEQFEVSEEESSESISTLNDKPRS